MIKLEIGRTYSTKELVQALNISYKNFIRKKDEFLANLAIAYKYETKNRGRTIFYTITEQINDYKPLERKNSRKKTDAIIKEFINKLIDKEPLQTAANINRKAWESYKTNPTSVASLGLKKSSTDEYIRILMREMFGTKVKRGGTDGEIEEKVWCYLDLNTNKYIEMTSEMLNAYFQCLKDIKQEWREADLNVCSDFEIGLINKWDLRKSLSKNIVNTYQECSKRFYDKYGYRPIKIPKYKRNK